MSDVDHRPDAACLASLRDYYLTSENYREHLEAKGIEYFEQFVHVVCRYSSPNDRILDLGCGTGETSRELSRRGRNVIGSDLSKLFMDRHHTTGEPGPTFVASDAAHLPFGDSTLDVVCAMEFIEHVWPVEGVLGEMNRVLKSGGHLVLMSPNLLSPLLALRDLPAMVRNHQFRPPFYTSYAEAVAFFKRCCSLSVKKMFSHKPQFVGREPDLRHADGGGDFDAVYCSNARDIILFLRQAGYRVEFAIGPCASAEIWFRRNAAKLLGSLWTSFLLKATKHS